VDWAQLSPFFLVIKYNIMQYKVKQSLRIKPSAGLGPFNNQDVTVIEVDPADKEYPYNVKDKTGSTVWLSGSKLKQRPRVIKGKRK
jgi:hypothetical protein